MDVVRHDSNDKRQILVRVFIEYLLCDINVKSTSFCEMMMHGPLVLAHVGAINYFLIEL